MDSSGTMRSFSGLSALVLMCPKEPEMVSTDLPQHRLGSRRGRLSGSGD